MDLQKMLEKLALSAQEALQSAMSIAGEAKAGMVEPIHMLAALLSSGEHNIDAIVKRLGADPKLLRDEVQAEIDRMPKVEGGGIMGMTKEAMSPMFGGQPQEQSVLPARQGGEDRREIGRFVRHK